MKYGGFSTDPRWLWEDTGCLQLCLIDARAREQEATIVDALQSVLTEFQLPLTIITANSATCHEARTVLAENSEANTIQCWQALKAINQRRPKISHLQTALVVAFDGVERQLLDESSHKPEEPPEWGWTAEDGLILLRLSAGQPLGNVVRHEMGHLLGIGQHHSNCLMDWSCQEESFCGHCKSTIRQTCQITG
jgi:hypothetical protein